MVSCFRAATLVVNSCVVIPGFRNTQIFVWKLGIRNFFGVDARAASYVSKGDVRLKIPSYLGIGSYSKE